MKTRSKIAIGAIVGISILLALLLFYCTKTSKYQQVLSEPDRDYQAAPLPERDYPVASAPKPAYKTAPAPERDYPSASKPKLAYKTAPAPERDYSDAPASPGDISSREPTFSEDPIELVDRILEKLRLGNIAFNTPKSMNLHNTAVIQLLLGATTPISELKRFVEEEGEKVGARIRISNRMEARLSGPNFAITAITPETQAVSLAEITEWKWEIKPKSTGHQLLHLTLSAIISVEGAATPRAIRTFDKVIEVEVTWNQQLTHFLKTNWQWLWAAILLPIAGWILRRKVSSRKANNNKNSS